MLPRVFHHRFSTHDVLSKLQRFPVDPSVNNVLELAKALTPHALYSLFTHKTSCVIVRGFYSHEESIQRIVQEIDSELKSKRERNWMVSQSDGKLVDSDVFTLGTPLNVAKGKNRVEEYYEHAVAATRKYREGNYGISPFDRLRLELDEVYPFGCLLGRDPETRLARAVGLMRIMRRTKSKGLVHVDDVDEFSEKRGVFSANVYLQNSLVGGEIEIWPVTFRTKEDLMKNALEIGLLTTHSGDPVSQRALRDHVLPNHPLIVAPKVGDLVLMCVQRPHAVRGPIHGPMARINAQTFIIREGDDSPLKLEV